MPINSYSNWNKRPLDDEKQIEPYRKYYFICEGANTESFYFKELVDQKKQLGIHASIDVILLEKTGAEKNITYPKSLLKLAEQQKSSLGGKFDRKHDKMIIVFDGDIFEEKVEGYDELLERIEENNIAGVTNPNFELFLLLHLDNTYEEMIKFHEKEFFNKDERNRYSYAYQLLHDKTGMNAKTNSEIGKLADNVLLAIEQEKNINQDVHQLKGKVSSNLGMIIESIINDSPDL